MFGISSQKSLETTDRLYRMGEQLIQDEHYAMDSIRPKHAELQRIRDQYKRMLRQRKEVLFKARDLHDRIDRVSITLVISKNRFSSLKHFAITR